MSATHQLFSILVLSLAAAHTAHADAAKDFSTGTAFRVGGGTVIVDKLSRTSTGGRVSKKATGSLDFAMRADELGIDLPVTIHFRGRAVGGGWVEYTVDDSYRDPIDLGEGYKLERIAGVIHMRALPLRGNEPHTDGNIRLSIVAPSTVTAYGTWGERPITITKLSVLGGVPQPVLQRFELAGKVACSEAKPTLYPLAISIADLARASGTHVELRTSRSAGVRVPPGIVILPGQQSAIVQAVIQPDFVGTTRVTASAGGVVKTLDVVVHASGDCR